MEEFIIRELQQQEEVPYELLLLADPSRKAIEQYIHRGISYVAGKEEGVVGIYVLIETRPFTFELVNVAVQEGYQGKGLGKALVLHAIDKAREAGGKVLEVGTGNSSIAQLALYQKCGFRIQSVDKDFFKKHYEEEIVENGIACVDMIRLSVDL